MLAGLVQRTCRPVTRCFLMFWSQNSWLFFSESENTYAHKHVRKITNKIKQWNYKPGCFSIFNPSKPEDCHPHIWTFTLYFTGKSITSPQ